MPTIEIMTVQFHLPGCASLKDKRQRLQGVRDRFGREPGIAICESAHQDSHDRAQWTYLAMATDAVVVERQLTMIERFLVENVDAVVGQIQRESL